MKINKEFKLIQIDDDDKNMVPELQMFYHFEEIDWLLGELEAERSLEAEIYLVHQAVGNTAMMAYRQDVIGQIHAAMQEVAEVAAEQLYDETVDYLSQQI